MYRECLVFNLEFVGPSLKNCTYYITPCLTAPVELFPTAGIKNSIDRNSIFQSLRKSSGDGFGVHFFTLNFEWGLNESLLPSGTEIVEYFS